MRDPLSILVRHLLGVWPALRPVGSHDNKRTRRNVSVFCFPFFHAFKRERVVRFFLRTPDERRHTHAWQDHFLKLDLIDRAQAFMKMRRLIYVCASLTDMSKDLGQKTVAHHVWLLFVPINRFPLFVGKTRPTRNAWREVVGKIHKLFAAHDLL